jgi:hypothetical protein
LACEDLQVAASPQNRALFSFPTKDPEKKKLKLNRWIRSRPQQRLLLSPPHPSQPVTRNNHKSNEEEDSENGRGREQGCQMVNFKTKNRNLGIFWRALEWKMLVYFTVITYDHLISYMAVGMVYCMIIWHSFPVLVCFDQEKSGNPGRGE